MLFLPRPERPVIHATCKDGYDGRVEYVIEHKGALQEKPRKAPTYALIALLVRNHALRVNPLEQRIPPIHWDEKARAYGGFKEAEKDNRRDPHEVRREELAAIRKALNKDIPDA